MSFLVLSVRSVCGFSFLHSKSSCGFFLLHMDFKRKSHRLRNRLIVSSCTRYLHVIPVLRLRWILYWTALHIINFGNAGVLCFLPGTNCIFKQQSANFTILKVVVTISFPSQASKLPSIQQSSQRNSVRTSCVPRLNIFHYPKPLDNFAYLLGVLVEFAVTNFWGEEGLVQYFHEWP